MPQGKIRQDQAIKQQQELQQKVSEQTLARELQRITDAAKQNNARVDQAKQAREPHIARILDNPAEKASVTLLANLTASLASSNIELNANNMAAKVASEMGKEIDLMMQTKPDTGDLSLLRETVAQKNPANVQTHQQQNKKGQQESGKDLSTSRETISVVKEYTAAYANCVVNASGEMKRKMERSESELRKRGLSEKDIRRIKGGVKKSVRNDLAKVIKQAFLKKMLIKGKSMESVAAAKGINDALSLAGSSKGAGSFDGMRGLAKEMAQQARAEAKGLILEKLEIQLMEKILSGQTKALEESIKSLVVLGMKLGVNMPLFIKKWKEKKIDLGLFVLDPKLSAQLGLGGNSEEEEEDRYEMTKADEKEVLLNRLRALYMRRAIKGDIITRLDTAFKMRRLKNGLIKLGLKIDDFDRLEKEGKAVARFKLMEMLKEALAERATLYDLAGPAFKLIEKRIKGIMSNLDRVGSALLVSEFENIRNTANRKMYEMAVQELHAVDAKIRVKANPRLEKKRGKLVKLIARLMEESKIKEVKIDQTKVELIRHGVEGMKIIQESA
jgi:hypothetical protein